MFLPVRGVGGGLPVPAGVEWACLLIFDGPVCRSLDAGQSAAIFYRFPEEPPPPDPSTEAAATQQQSLWASPELLWLSLVALLCVRPERWMEAALVGDVLERQRVNFSRVRGRGSVSRG